MVQLLALCCLAQQRENMAVGGFRPPPPKGLSGLNDFKVIHEMLQDISISDKLLVAFLGNLFCIGDPHVIS